MAGSSNTAKEADSFVDEVKEHAKKALSTTDPRWSDIEKVINWLRKVLRDCLTEELRKLNVIERLATRIGVTILELCFMVISSTISLLRVIICQKNFWEAAHESATKAWNSNEDRGLLAQSYAYSQRMAAFIIELIKQCMERAIKAKGLEVDENDKKTISDLVESFQTIL